MSDVVEMPTVLSLHLLKLTASNSIIPLLQFAPPFLIFIQAYAFVFQADFHELQPYRHRVIYANQHIVYSSV